MNLSEPALLQQVCRICGSLRLVLLRYQKVIYRVNHWPFLLLTLKTPLEQRLSFTSSQLFKVPTLTHNLLNSSHEHCVLLKRFRTFYEEAQTVMWSTLRLALIKVALVASLWLRGKYFVKTIVLMTINAPK